MVLFIGHAAENTSNRPILAQHGQRGVVLGLDD